MSSPGKKTSNLKNNPWMKRDEKRRKEVKQKGGSGSRQGNSNGSAYLPKSNNSSSKAEANRRVNKRVQQLKNEKREDDKPQGSLWSSEEQRKLGSGSSYQKFNKKNEAQSSAGKPKMWKPPQHGSNATRPKPESSAVKPKAAPKRTWQSNTTASQGASMKKWQPPSSRPKATQTKSLVPAVQKQAGAEASAGKTMNPWKPASKAVKSTQPKAESRKGMPMKPWKPQIAAANSPGSQTKTSRDESAKQPKQKYASEKAKARSKSPTWRKQITPAGNGKSQGASLKSKAIEAAEAFSRQIADGEEKEEYPSDEGSVRPQLKRETRSAPTIAKSNLAKDDPVLARPIRSVKGRWSPKGNTLPEKDKRVSKPRQFNAHRAMTTPIQRLPPPETVLVTSKPVPVRMFSRQDLRIDTVKSKFEQQKIAERKGLKKILLGKRRSNVLKWSILARNLGLATSMIFPVFGAFAMGWSGALASRFRTPLERQYLYTYDYVGIAAIALGTVLHLIETMLGLVITAEKLFGFVILYTLSAMLALFSNALILPCILSLLTAVLKLLSIIEAEEGTVKLKPRQMFTSWWIDRSSSHTYVMFLYFLLNIGVFLIRFYYYMDFVRLPCIALVPNEATCISLVGVIAKGFGYSLNLNCACIFLPVLRVLMSKCIKSNRQSIRLNAQRIAAKNITMHRTIGWLILLGVCGHVGCHYVNLGLRPQVTIDLFGHYSFTTGIMLTCTFVVMLAGLEPTIKRAHYAVFWRTHYFFLPFVLILLAHSPEFWKWMAAPMVLFFIEKYYSKFVRGQTKFYVLDVEYLHPVMTLKFRPERDQDFKFEEGQYLLINVPQVSEYEWHPFTISSAYDDLCQSENGYVSISMKVTGDGRWTDKVKDYLKELSGNMTYLKDVDGKYLRNEDGDLIQDPEKRHVDFNSVHTRRDSNGNRLKSPFHHIDSKGKHRPGLLRGPDGKRIIYIDGPFQAPTQSYANYEDVMLVGSGIGLTPASAILRAVLRHKWKKGFKPRTLRFYWVLSHKEIGSYRWFMRLVTRLLASYEFDKRNGALKFSGSEEHENYIEMNIYITSIPANFNENEVLEMRQPPQSLEEPSCELDEQISQMQRDLGISEQDIHNALLRPTKPSSSQIDEQVYDEEKYPLNPDFNNLHMWVWKGRPKWDDIFHQVKVRTEEYSDGDKVGVCFCGNPVISQDLKSQCKKQSSRQVSFYLHSETFG